MASRLSCCWLLLNATIGTLVVGDTVSLRFVPGYFVQSLNGSRAVRPPNFGLHQDVTWSDVYKRIAKSPLKAKLILLLRHGQGTHNVAIDKYGSDAWNLYLRALSVFTDAPLTTLGIEQARNASMELVEQIEKGLCVHQVVVSPLDRALATYNSAFASLGSIPHRVVENARETLGVYTCDKRRTITEKKRDFPKLDFSGVMTDVDELWSPTHRETDNENDIRAGSFLSELMGHPGANTIAVVTHNLFSAACLRILGHPPYSLATGEFLPVLIESTA